MRKENKLGLVYFVALSRMSKQIDQQHYQSSLHSFPLLSFKFPVANYMFKVNNKNTRTRYEICSKLTIKT